jgi:hypothetical protein
VVEVRLEWLGLALYQTVMANPEDFDRLNELLKTGRVSKLEYEAARFSLMSGQRPEGAIDVLIAPDSTYTTVAEPDWMRYGRIDHQRHRSKAKFGAFVAIALILALVIGVLGIERRSSAPRAKATPNVLATERAAAFRCNNDAATVALAVAAFDARYAPASVNYEASGRQPGAVTVGDPTTYARAHWAQLLVSRYFLASWPSSGTQYAISLSSGIGAPGDVIVYVPSTSRDGVDYNAQTDSSGCNRLLAH